MGLPCKECDSKLFKFGIVLGSSEFKEFAGVGGTSVLFNMGIVSDRFRLLCLRFRKCIVECSEAVMIFGGIGFGIVLACGECDVLGVLGPGCSDGEGLEGTC